MHLCSCKVQPIGVLSIRNVDCDQNIFHGSGQNELFFNASVHANDKALKHIGMTLHIVAG